ncbi:hypothetical protein Q9233_017113 [Columba guinea]|nr:hypothetical protein Q9233_017113 [Columba guinea]
MAVPLPSAALCGVRSGRRSARPAFCVWVFWVLEFIMYVIFSPLSEEPKPDISLPHEKLLRAKEIKAREKIPREIRQNAELERAARLRTALIPLDAVRAEWEKSSGPFHKQREAEHCAVFRDLFRGGTFPRVTLRVQCSQEDEHAVPVCYGNMASRCPAVSSEADKGSLRTVLLTNREGR